MSIKLKIILFFFAGFVFGLTLGYIFFHDDSEKEETVLKDYSKEQNQPEGLPSQIKIIVKEIKNNEIKYEYSDLLEKRSKKTGVIEIQDDNVDIFIKKQFDYPAIIDKKLIKKLNNLKQEQVQVNLRESEKMEALNNEIEKIKKEISHTKAIFIDNINNEIKNTNDEEKKRKLLEELRAFSGNYELLPAKISDIKQGDILFVYSSKEIILGEAISVNRIEIIRDAK